MQQIVNISGNASLIRKVKCGDLTAVGGIDELRIYRHADVPVKVATIRMQDGKVSIIAHEPVSVEQ